MITLICFDLDGTLIDSKDLHYQSLNAALTRIAPEYVISYEDHLQRFDGLPTKTKLTMLIESGLDPALCDAINAEKQRITLDMLEVYDFGIDHRPMMLELAKTYQLALCTNSIRPTTDLILRRLEISDVFDWIITNEDAAPKPDPAMYQLAIQRAGVLPIDTLVIEDNHKGIEAALAADAHLYVVSGAKDVTLSSIRAAIEQIHNTLPSIK